MSELAPITDVIVSSGFLAAIDNIWVMLAVVVISAVSSWLQSRNKKEGQPQPWGGEDDETYRQQRTGSGSSPPPNPNQPLNWEEELKRLLDGKPPLDGTAGTPPPPPPPTPVIRRTPPPVPEPVSRESEGIDEESIASRESSSPWQETALDSLPEPNKPLTTLGKSTHAYQRATQLHETVAARMRHVDEQTEKHGKPLLAPVPIGRAINVDARAVVALLRQPATVRQALIASFVLAPPKALES